MSNSERKPKTPYTTSQQWTTTLKPTQQCQTDLNQEEAASQDDLAEDDNLQTGNDILT